MGRTAAKVSLDSDTINIESLTGSGGVGGGNNTYSTMQQDFTASVTDGTNDIVLSVDSIGGIPIDEGIVQSGILEVYDASTSSSIKISLDGFTWTSGTKTIDTTNCTNAFTFNTGDIVSLTLIGPDKGYDAGLDAQKNIKQNQNDFINVEHPIDSTNDDETTIRTIIESEGKRGGTFHLKCSGGVTMTVWASNDSSADDTADTGWVEVGEDWLQMPAGGLVDDEGIYVLDTQIMPERFMIKYVTSDATNATDAWVNSYNPF